MDFMDYADTVLEYVENGGPLLGILFPVIEAFLPFLPLVGFVIINVGVFGLFWGYIYSWIGNCLGSYLLFLIIKKAGRNKLEKRISEHKYSATLEKIRKKNFSVLFFLYCFPFTPSFLISGAAALANMGKQQFLLILIPSKLVMMISLAFIGQNVRSFFKNPMASIFFILLILLLNMISKKIVEIYERKHRKIK